MADLNDLDSALTIKIVGATSTGVETNAVGADINGNLQTINPSDGPVSPGSAALNSSLIGGQFNTTLPTLTNTQQSSIQVDNRGRLLISSVATPVATPSNSIVTVSNSVSTLILASNTNRRMAYITNNNNKSLWIKLGATAVVGQGIEIGGGGSFGIDSTGLWTGVVNGIVSGPSSLPIDVFEGTN